MQIHWTGAGKNIFDKIKIISKIGSGFQGETYLIQINNKELIFKRQKITENEYVNNTFDNQNYREIQFYKWINKLNDFALRIKYVSVNNWYIFFIKKCIIYIIYIVYPVMIPYNMWNWHYILVTYNVRFAYYTGLRLIHAVQNIFFILNANSLNGQVVVIWLLSKIKLL